MSLLKFVQIATAITVNDDVTDRRLYALDDDGQVWFFHDGKPGKPSYWSPLTMKTKQEVEEDE